MRHKFYKLIFCRYAFKIFNKDGDSVGTIGAGNILYTDLRSGSLLFLLNRAIFRECSVVYCTADMDNGQGWEFVHPFSERIARFLQENDRMSDSLEKTSDLLI